MPTSDIDELCTLLNNLNSQQIEHNENEKLNLFKKIKLEISQLSSDTLNWLIMHKKDLFDSLFENITLEFNNNELSSGDLILRSESLEIFEKILSNFINLNKLLEIFAREFQHLFSLDNNEKLQTICLTKFYELLRRLRLAEENQVVSSSQSLVVYLNDLLPLILNRIPANTSSYSQLVSKFLCELVQVNSIELHGASLVFNQKSNLKIIAQKDEINFFRVFEILINLASVSKDILNEIELNFGLNEMINSKFYHSKDILAKLNTIEMLKDLAQTTHGFELLDSNDHLKNLAAHFTLNDDIEFSALYMPSIIKLFGHLAYIKPQEIMGRYSVFFDRLFATFFDEELGESEVVLAMDTFSFIFSNSHAKLLFFTKISDNLKEKLYSRLLRLFNFSINKLKSKSIELMSTLVSCGNNRTMEIIQLNQTIFNVLLQQCDRLVLKMIDIAYQPFLDSRLATHNFFKSLIQNDWAIDYLFQTDSLNKRFFEYLLNRSTELEIDGRQSKYELIRALSQSDYIYGRIETAKLSSLNRYVREGPFYKETQLATAFESQ
jgi:hypothetical protein